MSDLFVMSGRPGGYYDRTFGQEALGQFYHTPQAAEQNWRTTRNHPTPWDYEPRRVTWQERERAKFDQEIYAHPIWVNETWYWDLGHYAHVSLDDPTKIAFTENDAKGDKDIQLRMKPGKYLSKFFPALTPKQIAFYAEWFTSGVRPTGEGLGKIQFASEPDDIVDVYRRGPYSCMRGDGEVHVYGAGDLSVAYVEDPGTGKAISRALCWPAKKVFGRVYPTLSSSGYWQHDFATQEEAQKVYDDLFFRLRDMGWTSYNEGGTLAGARLLRQTDDGGYIVGPYVDGYENVHEDPTGDKRYLILGDQTWESRNKYGGATHHRAQNTSGYFGAEPDEYNEPEYDWTCQRCEEGMSDSDTMNSVYDGWAPGTGPFGEEDWCSCCAHHSDRTFYCEETDTTYDDRATDSVRIIHNEHGSEMTVVLGWAQENGFKSDLSCEWFTDDQLVEMHDGETWGRSEFLEDGFQCSYDNKNYPNSEASEKHPGWPADMDSMPFTLAFRRKHGPQ